MTPVTRPVTRWSTGCDVDRRLWSMLDDGSYYDYQVNRPVIRQVDGVTRELVLALDADIALPTARQ